MLWRISAALAAIYFVHGSENLARDSAHLASEIRQEVPQAVIAACIDKPEICQKVLRHASGHSGAPVSVVTPAPGAASRQEEAAPNGLKTSAVPVVSGEFPLPPVRPASLAPRKKA